MVRDIICINLANVARYRVGGWKIGAIGLLCKSVPFGCEYTLPTYRFETKSRSAYPRKQIDEGEIWLGGLTLVARLLKQSKCGINNEARVLD